MLRLRSKLQRHLWQAVSAWRQGSHTLSIVHGKGRQRRIAAGAVAYLLFDREQAFLRASLRFAKRASPANRKLPLSIVLRSR